MPDLDFVLAVHRYATPFAILLVGMGLWNTPPGAIRAVCAGLLIFSVAYNLVAVELMKRGPVPAWLMQARQAVNFAINCVTVTLLAWYWEPIWMLLFLTPLVTALARDRRRTIFAAVGTAVELLALNGVRWSVGSELRWSNQVTYALATIVIALLLNEITALVKAQKS